MKKKCIFSFSAGGFSLAELIIIVVIIAISVGLGVPYYNNAVLKAQQKEVLALTEAIRDAERIYYIEHDTYVTCDDNEDCNSVLKVSLPVSDEDSAWSYFVRTDEPEEYFCVGAEKEGAPDYCLPGEVDRELMEGTCTDAGCD